MRRSGTEKRKRIHQVGVRLLPEEWAALTAEAERRGVSPGEVLRASFLNRERADRIGGDA